MRCFGEDTVLRILQGELEEPARDAAERHMAECAECRGLVADAAKALLSSGGGTTTSADVGLEPLLLRSGLSEGQRFGRYVIGRRLGAGGGGIVYAANDSDLGRNVALKVLRDDGLPHADRRRAALLREARAMARLAHPNIVAIYDAGALDGQVFIAMELVEGPTLAAWMRQTRPSWRQMLEVFVGAGRGLAAAHAAGIVHRDFKPANVLLGGDGRARVTDFGLARPLPAGSAEVASWGSEVTLTGPGQIKGTPAYMAPEQLLGGNVDARADQFSFAVALYEALYGARPFAGESLGSLVDQVLHAEPAPPPKDSRVPAAIGAAVMRALSRKRELRFASMEQLLAVLGDGAQRLRAGRYLVAGGAVIGAAIVVAGVALSLRAAPRERDGGAPTAAAAAASAAALAPAATSVPAVSKPAASLVAPAEPDPSTQPEVPAPRPRAPACATERPAHHRASPASPKVDPYDHL